jgi:uncharacterized protein (TIGR01777 family)
MRIVISGGTGFVGRALVSRLAARKDQVSVLTRSGSLPKGLAELSGVEAVKWDPPSAGPWQKALEGADAVVHLAGEQAVGQRWTAEVKQRLITSRVDGARALVDTFPKLERSPRVFVSASGVGFYGGRLDDALMNESSAPGDDFLAKLCVQWESAVAAAEAYGARVAFVRLGVVFGREGGGLEEMVKPFRWFVGGPVGSGRQYFSWIHLDDAVEIFVRALDDERLRGPINAVAPRAVPQAEIAKAIGRVLHRPAFLRAPTFALKTLFGEGAAPIVTGQNVEPKVLKDAGFTWKFGELDRALLDCLAPRSA